MSTSRESTSTSHIDESAISSILLDDGSDSDSDFSEVELPTRENISESETSSDDDAPEVGAGDAGQNQSWSTYKGPDFSHFPYTLNGGYNKPINNPPVSPLNSFQLFFSDELLQEIVAETNRYAAEKINKQRPLPKRSIWHTWIDTDLVEMKAFLGVILNMALNPKPSIQDFFSAEWVFHQPFFVNVFSRERFSQLFWCLHVSPPDPVARNRTRGDKVKNIVTYLQARSMEHFTPLYECSIDESTVAFKGRVMFKCYNAMKPTKWGLRVFVLSDSRTGYVYNFEPYYGATTTNNLVRPDLPFTSRIVIHLAEKLSSGKNAGSGFHIFTDRYYTSVLLGAELKKMNMHLTGTIMGNRKGLPEGVKKGKLKLKKHDAKFFRHEDDFMVAAWKDKRDVLMFSSYCNDDIKVIERREKNNVVTQVPKPSVICEYNQYMGGVDHADQYIASYQFSRKSVKWWRKMFFWLLEVAVVNSFLLFNMNAANNGKKETAHRKYRETLITELVGDVRNRTTLKRSRPSTTEQEERLNKMPHFLAAHPTKKTKDCAVCSNRKVQGGRKETLYFCKTCTKKPGLHPADCFERYHTLKKFKTYE